MAGLQQEKSPVSYHFLSPRYILTCYSVSIIDHARASRGKSSQIKPARLPARILNRDYNIPTWNVVFEGVLQPPDAQSHTRLCLLFYCPPSEL